MPSVTAKRSSAAALSARSAKCTPFRTRAGATTSRCRGGDPVPAPLDWDEWLGVSADAAVQARRVPPGRVAPARRVRHRHARRHGLPHLQPAVPRAEADVARCRSPRTARADGGELGHQGARQADLSRHASTPPDKTVDVWWYDGGELPPRRDSRADRRPLPEQGSVVVGTDGLLVLPHGSRRSVRAAGLEDGRAAAVRSRRIAITTASSSTSCSPAASRTARRASTTPARLPSR